MALTDPCLQVLRALSVRSHFQGSTRLDEIMVMVTTDLHFADVEEALQHLQLLGYARSITRGHWFVTLEGNAALAQQEAADG